MPTETVQFTDTLKLTRPFILMVGRKRQEVREPARFQIKRARAQGVSPETGLVEFISTLPIHEVYSLFIGGKLFSTTRPTGTRRASARISRPRSKSGRLTIKLVRKYTELAAQEKQ